MESELALDPLKVKAGQKYQICTRCIMDTSVRGITFNGKGECNFCEVHDLLDHEYSLDGKAQRELARLVGAIRRKGRGKKYDCVTGISGGRDSTYTLFYVTKVLGLRPLAVHFNDGFSNPTAGENMLKATRKLGVELRTITSDWRESKDLKITFLKASTPDLEVGTDIGIGAALYGAAAKENLNYVLIGQSFRTEGIAPLSWNYLDCTYMKAVHRQFGTANLRKWRSADPGFHLDIPQIAYYSLLRGIKSIPILYYVNYVRTEAEAVIKKEFDWVYPGAHYYDDLYQSLMTYILRVKFNIDRRLHNYSALVRSGQMLREDALARVKEVYVIEDPKVISLCIKRLGITQEEFDAYMALPPKTFHDYPNQYDLIKKFEWTIKFMSQWNLLPGSTYCKYFRCGH